MSAATIENTIVTYRLSNGTHILIHNTEPKDSISGSNLAQTFAAQPSTYFDTNAVPTENVEVVDSKLNWSTEPAENNKEISEITEDALNLPDGYHFSTSNCDGMTLDPFGEIVMSFKCRSCSFLSEDRNELLEHFEISHADEKILEDSNANEVKPLMEQDGTTNKNETEVGSEARIVYLCGECNELLSSIAECRQHMLDSHNLSLNLDGEVASQELKPTTEALELDEVLLDEESQSSHSDRKEGSSHSCKVRGCPVKLPTSSALANHTRCHTSSTSTLDGDSSTQTRPRFRCFECGEGCVTWRECATHLHREHGIDAGMLACPTCRYKTLTRVKLRNHMKTHDDARPYACTQPGCERRFKQATQLRNHKVLHMDRNTVKVPRWYSSQKCDICSKTYADSKCLKKHIQAVHSKLRPYVCGVCGHASARKAMLQMHARQHTGEKPHACAICPYRTGDHNSLRRHRMRHSGLKPYSCPHCPYAAIQSNSYKNHLRSRHPGMPGAFYCDDCDFRSVNQEALDSHAKHHVAGNGGPTADYFPENALAADMIYRCLGGADKWRADVTGSATSADGLTQTITIRLPVSGDDDESRCFLAQHLDRDEEEEVDTGGITIPADPMCL